MRKLNEKQNLEKGITLIALVITIVVLLILAAVSITAVFGDNGLLMLAKEAADKTNEAVGKEQEDVSKLKNFLENQLVEVTPTPEVVKNLTSADLNANPQKYFGMEVEGYSCQSDGVQSWQLYYADDQNAYLIASDYILYNKAPNGRNETRVNSNTPYYDEYSVYIGPFIDYLGSNDIKDERIKALNSSYYNYLQENTISDTSIDARMMAYLLDTNAWSIYEGEKADYAIGGPTLELLFKSYNAKYGTNYIAKVEDDLGYKVSNKDGNDFRISDETNLYCQLEHIDSLYVNVHDDFSDGLGVSLQWIASVVGDREYDAEMYTVGSRNMNGSCAVYTPDDPDWMGIRPVVCLSNSVKFKEKGGKLMIFDE